jgi:osmoprotectant transport system permease protein
VITRVEFPLALPLIFAGIRTATVFVVATATLAGVVGGGSLGDIIFNQPTYFLSGVIGAAFVVQFLALVAYLLFVVLQRLLTPRGLLHADAMERSEEEPPVVFEAVAT